MTQTKTSPRREPKERTADRPREQREPVPTWRNTRPRGNPEPDPRDVERFRERMEALLGR